MFALQGSVSEFRVNMTGINQSIERVYEPSTTSTVIGHLQPSIAYTISLTLVTHGGATITSEPISVRTKDGGKIYFVYNFAIYQKNYQTNMSIQSSHRSPSLDFEFLSILE